MDIDDLRVGDTQPVPFGQYPALSEFLKKGGDIHGFRSGGGLRVIRASLNDELKGYGEHPYVEHAFNHCEEDLIAGGRDYRSVYGKLYDHYLTGSSTPSSIVDQWMCCGYGLDITFEENMFVFRGEYYFHVKPPQDRVKLGKPFHFKYKDVTYYVYDLILGNYSMKAVDNPLNRDTFMLKEVMELRASTLEGLLAKMNATLNDKDPERVEKESVLVEQVESGWQVIEPTPGVTIEHHELTQRDLPPTL